MVKMVNTSGSFNQYFMKSYRLNRLFNARSNRCFDVAVDHGFFNERGFLQGIENLEKAKEVVGTIDRVHELCLHVRGIVTDLQIATVLALREWLFAANFNEIVHFLYREYLHIQDASQ